jgi:peptide/nickel transport system substrate-binding protein/oligopeptide transport system substrate-binding protein
MQVRRLAIWSVLPVAIAVGLSACGGGDEGGAGGTVDPNGVARIGISEPQHLVPTNTNETSGSQVLAALYSPLVTYDEANKPVEVAAESITTTDNKEWTVKLKPGYTFHNGEPVTADSYIDAWNYGAYGPNSQLNNYFFTNIDGYAALNPADPDGEEGPQTAPVPPTNKLTGLEKVDDTTFTVTLAEPFSEFKVMLGYTAFYPMPKAAFNPDGTVVESFEQAPIGQGPFKMNGTWQHDDQIQVTRYDEFAGEKPKIGGATFKIYQQDTAEYADLTADNLDVMKQIPTANLATAESDLGDRFQHSPASSFQFVAFPTFDPAYANVDVRKAISKAIDRDEIISAVFKDSQESARSFVSPVVAGYRENTCGEACEFNPEQAKAEYTAAGGPSTITITYNADGGHKDWVDATCNQLKKNLGVECVAQPEPKFADLLTKVRAKQPVGMFRLGWVMDYPSMENYLGPLYSTTGSSNYYGYSNPEFDTLVQEGRTAATADEAIAKYQAAEDLLVRDMPVIPLRFGQNNFGFSTNVQNVQIDLFDRVDLNKIEVLTGD